MFEVFLSRQAAAALELLPKTIHARMLKLFERLADWPNVSGAKPLKGKLAGRWRLRTGDYRVQFRVEGRRIVIEQLGHRDGFYGD